VAGSVRFRHTLTGLLVTLLLFVAIEIILRLFVTIGHDYLEKRGDVIYEYKLWQTHLFDSFMGMHQSDPELFWKMKPNFRSGLLETNRDGFIGLPISKKQSEEFRILFLGDSTPLGIGLTDFHNSFVFSLEKLLQEAIPKRHISVINTATAGYSSWQCRRLLELRGEQLQPDLVITYFGNNDPSINGYLSDRQLFEVSSRYHSLKGLLARSYTYQLLKALLLRMKQPGTASLQVRVTPEEFRKNLSAISKWCDNHGSKLAFCTIPAPSLWPPGIQFKVFASGHDKMGRLVMSEQMRTDIGGKWSLCLDTLLLPGRHDLWAKRIYATAFTDSEDPGLAKRFYRKQLAADAVNPQYLNNLGVILWQSGEDASVLFDRARAIDSLNPIILYNLGISSFHRDSVLAIDYLQQAKELDNYSLRIKSEYNQIFHESASQFGIGLVDLEMLFTGLPETDHFVDHCHPTLKGHKLIAQKLVEEIVLLIPD